VDKAQKAGITSEVTLEPSVTAPVLKGQRLGMLTVKTGDQVLSRIPLVASETVDRLTWGDLFVKLLQKAAMAKSES
jgi:D-alanyl-D-alanine carboxypeptidase (penicillin-binding protein 5/6)